MTLKVSHNKQSKTSLPQTPQIHALLLKFTRTNNMEKYVNIEFLKPVLSFKWKCKMNLVKYDKKVVNVNIIYVMCRSGFD
jgi:hypothetical protein